MGVVKWARAQQPEQNDLCAKQRLRSAWAFAKSDQSLLSTWSFSSLTYRAEVQADLSLH